MTRDRFEWQEGYGVISYSHSHIDKVYKYIKIRKLIIKYKHLKKSIQVFLKKFKIEYDEQYLFQELV